MKHPLIIRFQASIDDVDRLVNFDGEVLSLVIGSLEDLHARLKEHFGTPQMNGERTLEIVRGIRNNQSLKGRYQTILNQAVVLLVSHFASSLGDLFRAAVDHRVNVKDDFTDVLLKEELRLSVRDVIERDGGNRRSIGDLIISKRSLSFQDMGATSKAFESYVGILIDRDICVNDIILGQAARHVIVHAASICDEKMIRQVSEAKPRRLKENLSVGQAVEFSPGEVKLLATAMLTYLTTVADKCGLE